MTIGDRDKRALLIFAGASVLAAGIYFWPTSDASNGVVSAGGAVEVTEKRLAKMRQVAATVPGKEEVNKRVLAELAAREKGIIQADTAAQAQAQLIQILRRVGKAQSQPVDIRGNEIGQVRTFGEDYGEVSVSATLDCRIDQLVNLLADITAQPELLATSDVRVGSAAGREKIVPVRLTVSGIVAKKLIPKKKGPSAF